MSTRRRGAPRRARASETGHTSPVHELASTAGRSSTERSAFSIPRFASAPAGPTMRHGGPPSRIRGIHEGMRRPRPPPSGGRFFSRRAGGFANAAPSAASSSVLSRRTPASSGGVAADRPAATSSSVTRAERTVAQPCVPRLCARPSSSRRQSMKALGRFVALAVLGWPGARAVAAPEADGALTSTSTACELGPWRSLSGWPALASDRWRLPSGTRGRVRARFLADRLRGRGPGGGSRSSSGCPAGPPSDSSASASETRPGRPS